MTTVWMLLLILVSIPANAGLFQNIKLNPQYEQYLMQPKMKSARPGTMSMTSQADSNSQMDLYVRKVLLGANPQGNSLTAKSASSPGGEESPLYQEIRDQLETSHQGIGVNEVNQINSSNQQFNL